MPARCGSLYQRNLKRIEKLTLELKSLLTEKSNFKIKKSKSKLALNRFKNLSILRLNFDII